MTGGGNPRLPSGFGWLMRVLVIAVLPLAVAPLSGGPPPDRRELLRIPVFAAPKEPAAARLTEKTVVGKVDGEPSPVVAARGPDDDLVVLVVLDLSEELGLADLARPALVSAIDALPARAAVALLRAADGLKAVVDPTTDRAAVTAAINSAAVSGRPGLLDSVEMTARIADGILSKAAVRVAVVYVTDSNIYSYREDYTNPVINSSDPHDMSRRFPEGLVREKISSLAGKLSGYEAPLFIVHLAYRTDTLNEAYQAGLMQLVATEGGTSVFCRSRGEIAGAIADTFRTIASHYSIVLRVPPRRSKIVQVQLEAEGQSLTYRSRFALPQ